jgi:hypothetical protein
VRRTVERKISGDERESIPRESYLLSVLKNTSTFAGARRFVRLRMDLAIIRDR